MSRIEELIREKCPDGVEYRTIDSLVSLMSPKGKIKSNDYLQIGKYPVIDQGKEFIGGYTNEAIPFLKDEYVIFGDHTCVVKYVDFEFVQGADGVKVLKADKNLIIPRFLYHCMTSIKMVLDYSRHWSKMKVEEIPVPPIEVQQEIVRILDKFTELEVKLQAELDARKKQRVYLINKSFEFDDSIPMIPLGEVADVQRGGSFQKKDFAEQGMPCIHYGQLYTRFGIETSKTLTYLSENFSGKHKIATKNDVIMAVTSENVDDVCTCLVWNGDEDVSVSGHAAIIHSTQLGKYLVYYFNTDKFYVQKSRIAQGTKVIEVSPEKLKNVLIPIPSIEIQKEIIEKLDYIDNLCNDNEKGLPAELAARHKQYEYYRDKLLTFERKVV